VELWRIKEEGFFKEAVTARGNRFLTGNGYFGVRGTLSEYRKGECTAITLAGVYDRVGNGWREPINAPNPLYKKLYCGEEVCAVTDNAPLEHKESLDFRRACVGRESVFRTENAGDVTLMTERFASRERVHLLLERTMVRVEKDCELTLLAGIDTDVWDINGPHFDRIAIGENNGILTAEGVTHEKGYKIFVAQKTCSNVETKEQLKESTEGIYKQISFFAKSGQEYIFDCYAVIGGEHTKDTEESMLKELTSAMKTGYNALLKEHTDSWEQEWRACEIIIKGDEKAMQAVNYSMYHLLCIAPRHTDSLSIAARGLSGQTYKGAVFWDTEMFMLDFFLNTNPDIARTLLKYRIDTLEGAREKAKTYGYEGAFYAWESQEGGYDACSDYNVTDVFTGRPVRTFFKDKQVHISSAIVYGIMKYIQRTGDESLLLNGGLEVIMECALFYCSRMIQRVGSEKYELRDVIGPDEYHERIDNDGYTNRMAKYVLEHAVELADKYPGELRKMKYMDAEKLLRIKQAASRIYVPKPDEETGLIEQFDGYFSLEDVSVEEVRSRLLHPKEYWGGSNGVASHTQVIKQADIVMWLAMFPEDFSLEIIRANWNYYEPRTEHGSSLSACMYALTSCRMGDAETAYPLFLKS